MKKFLLSLVALAGFGFAMNAAETTLTASQITNLTETNKDISGQTFTVDSYSFTFEKNDAATAPAFYNSNNVMDLRAYAKNTLKVTAASEMTKMVFDLSDVARVCTLTCSTGTMTYSADAKTYTWTGSAKEVIITVPEKADLSSDTSKAAQFRFSQVTITGEGGSGVEVSAAPVITPASGAYVPAGGMTVTITAAEGATIYYTTDGNDPTTASDQYTQPIVIMNPCTVKAMAVEPGKNPSAIVSATYKDAGAFACANIAEFLTKAKDDEENTYVITGNVRVVYQAGSNMYIQDMNAPYTGLLVYGKLNQTYNPGDVINSIAGKYKNYFSTIEFMADAATFLAPAATGDAPKATEMGIEDVTAENQNLYVEIKSVTVSNYNEETKSFTLTDAKDATLEGYNKFNQQVTVPTDGKAYDVKGFISYYQAKDADAPAIQFYPTEFNEPGSVNGIAIDFNRPAEYYSIDGVRVAQPENGIYIVRQGNVVKKVIIRK